MTAVSQRLAEAISLGLTLPTVFFSVLVVVLFWKPAIKAIKAGDERNHIDWLKLGIWIGFAGSTVDNIYWGVAWSLSFLEFEQMKDLVFRNGVYSNIPFRQVAGMMAAYCHIKCVVELSKGSTDFRLLISTGAGALYVAILVAIKTLFKFKQEPF